MHGFIEIELKFELDSIKISTQSVINLTKKMGFLGKEGMNQKFRPKISLNETFLMRKEFKEEVHQCHITHGVGSSSHLVCV
jgi:hypothetical protein